MSVRRPTGPGVAARAHIAVAVFTFALVGATSWGQARASNSVELSTAARRLGAPQFVDRQRAGDTLLKAGTSAIPYLRKATESDSPEIRSRASGILERIELQILDAQKAEILAGALPEGEFPAWDRYLQIVDDTAQARRFFVAMLDRSPQLLLSIGSPELAVEFDRTISEWAPTASPWLSRTSPTSVEVLAALLVAASQPECEPTTSQVQLISRSAEYRTFSNEVQKSERQQALKSILVTWILSKGRLPADSRLHLAHHYKYREGAVPAREILAKNAGGLETQNALLFLGMYGEQQDIPLMEKFLNNSTELQTFQSQQTKESMKTQVCDISLAMLWKLHGEDPAAHGIRNYLEQSGSPRPGTIGFETDEARQQAIRHWREWRTSHVQADLPPDGWAVEGDRA